MASSFEAERQFASIIRKKEEKYTHKLKGDARLKLRSIVVIILIALIDEVIIDICSDDIDLEVT